MQVVAVAPFPVGLLRWRSGGPAASVIVKVSFALQNAAVAQLAQVQLPLFTAAQQSGHPPDFVPGKARADVILYGHAHAAQPQQAIAFGFAIGPLRRKLCARAERPSERVALSSDNVFAGAGAEDTAVRIGFITQGRDEEERELGDLSRFNVAPREQQLSELSCDCLIELQNLVAGQPLLRTRLPGLRPCVFVQPVVGGPAERLALQFDTLVVDTDRVVAATVWRGVVRGEEPAKLIVAVEPQQAPLSWHEVERQVAGTLRDEVSGADDCSESEQTADMPTSPAAYATLPFRSAQPKSLTAVAPAPVAPAPVAPAPVAPAPVAQAPVAPAPVVPTPVVPTPVVPAPVVPAPVVPAPVVPAPVVPAPVMPVHRAASAPPVRPPNPIAELASEPHGPELIDPELSAAEQPAAEPTAAEDMRSADEVTLEQYGAVCAALDLMPDARDEVLQHERLADSTWEQAARRWEEHLVSASRHGDTVPRHRCDDAYLARIEQARGAVEVADYVRLQLAVERCQNDAVVEALRVPARSNPVIRRVWLRRLIAEPELAASVRRETKAQRAQ